MEHDQHFHYHYSASQQEEIKAIREKYAPREESKLEQLRRLDKSASRAGSITALCMGMLSTLILGVGMCLCLVWERYLPGVLVGAVGIAGTAAAYPLYTFITRKRREKLAPEMIRLADELLQ